MAQIDHQKRWQVVAASYREQMQTPYHKNRIGIVEALLTKQDLSKTVLDFGCGDGICSERVIVAGGRVVAVDLESSMVKSTQNRLDACARNCRSSGYSVQCGGTETLTRYADESFDTVLAVNVLAYMDKPEEHLFYTQSHRILRPGGVLVVTHSNELFDLYTLNKYTVAFFKRHFSTHASMEDISTLLLHPDEPDRHVFPVRENPLNYKHKLLSYGFIEKQQEFSILHRLPPLLMKHFDPDDLQSRDCPQTMDWPETEKWKLLFMCSIFGSRAVRI